MDCQPMKRNIPTHRYSSRGDTYRYSSLTSHSIATWRFDIAHMDFFLFSTWGRKISSEESNETSEGMILAYVENIFSPRGD